MPLIKRIRLLLWLFILGLAIAGVTAIPLVPEVDALVRFFGADLPSANPSWLVTWLLTVRRGLALMSANAPFLFYGTDWLAFGHFVIAIAFIGPLRDPVKNIWVVEFGIWASVLVIPFALIFGEVRGIPLDWRFVDCCFGFAGIALLWPCRNLIAELSKQKI